MKKAVIISALGEKTFNRAQVKRIRKAVDAEFIKRLKTVSAAELASIACGADLLAITRRVTKNFDGSFIDSLPGLKGLCVYSTGCEWIDTRLLGRKGIKLSFLPDYSTVSVAEHAVGAMLVFSRRIHLSHDKSRNMLPAGVSLQGSELRGKTLGLIGYGRIGREVAKLGRAFGMTVRYYDKKRPAGTAARAEVFASADFVALACSQERDGRRVISAKELNMMKKGAYLINPARPGLVDNTAVIAALRKRTLAGYMVDDFLPELSSVKGLDHGRILQTFHTGWYSKEAITRGTEAWVENIVSMAGNKPKNLFMAGHGK